MDWKLFGTIFVSIFIAELGDKTQFAAIAASAKSQSTITVIIAVVLALAVAGTLGVLFGKVLGEFISPNIMRWVSGTLFIAIGVWTLIDK